MLGLILLFLFYLNALVATCVLVVGGAGYIGSHVNEKLYQNGYQTIVLDNLSSGNRDAVLHGTFIHGNFGDAELLDVIFSTYQIDAVMHFAAVMQIDESAANPLKYYRNNVAATLNLLEAMHRHGVGLFIFSSTAAIFAPSEDHYLREDHPTLPVTPYGQTKLMVETILKDCDRAYGMRYTALRYFNAAGGDPTGKLKNFREQPSLIPVVLRKLQKGEPIVIFGTDYPTPDGTCLRDYIHVDDLAMAHILAMERLLEGAPSACYNLGNGRGYSVREVIAAAEKVTGIKAQVIEGARRVGDLHTPLADPSKARVELGWEPRYSGLEEIIRHAWGATAQ